jgi:Type II secretory pathway, component PulJ
MTLLELVISMCISIIVILMIIVFISGALRVFHKTNNEVNLQMEGQTAINQLVDLSMEAITISDKKTPYAQDERYEIDNPMNDYIVVFRKDSNKLYLIEKTGSVTLESATPNDQENLIAEYVSSFSITNITAGDATRKEITMTLLLGDETATVKKNVNLRNAIH